MGQVLPGRGCVTDTSGAQIHSLRVRRNSTGRSRVNGDPVKQPCRGVPCQSRSTTLATGSPA